MASVAGAGYDPLATAAASARRRSRAGVYLLLTLFAAYYLLPLLVVALNSVRDLQEINRAGLLGLPRGLDLGAWGGPGAGSASAGAARGSSPSSGTRS